MVMMIMMTISIKVAEGWDLIEAIKGKGWGWSGEGKMNKNCYDSCHKECMSFKGVSPSSCKQKCTPICRGAPEGGNMEVLSHP